VPTNPKSEIRNAKSAALQPPQFGLRTLLALTTVCAALLALLQWLHPAAVVLLGFLGLSIFCHVAGNAIGTRLRQIGDSRDAASTGPSAIVSPQHHDFAPVTQLSRRQGLGWLIVIATSVGIASGAVGGGLWTFVSSRGQVGVSEIAIGIIAFAFLGGMAAFAVFSFTQVLSSAIWQALGHSANQSRAAVISEQPAPAKRPEALQR
jgi:hypothetical protein